MPSPGTNLIPKEEQWSLTQRDVSPTELKALANNIIANDDKVVSDPIKNSILGFLAGDKVKQWSDYWVTIINTLGLGYITSRDNKIHKTKLAEYIAHGGELDEYYLLWSLLFQYPFAQTKHKEFKENGIVINPGQILVQALVYLVTLSRERVGINYFQEAYLTAEEMILILMKLKSNNTYEIFEKTNVIYNNRLNSFDYTSLKIQGYDIVEAKLVGRTRLYLEKSKIIKFSADKKRILIENWKHFEQCENYLSYRKNGMKINVETEELDRIAFFGETFNNNIDPNNFYKKVHAFDESINESNVVYDEVKAVSDNLLNNGFHFTFEFIERFLLSAKAKPFIILSGISGVGKSLLPKAFMQLIGNNNCRAIAVSPDWTDNSDMLGYFDINNKFVAGEFTNVVLDASKNLHIPYFLVLDEMNLAKVEYYFAQVLSVMESRYYNALTGRCEYREYLFNLGLQRRLKSSAIENENELADLKIPPNLVIVGTVNIDESTHSFSKKVLDRSNVLEFNSVNLMIGFNELSSTNADVSILCNSQNFIGSITSLLELHKHWILNLNLEAKYDFNTYIEKWIQELEKFNLVLERHHLNFGLRMRDEVCIYLYYAALRNISNTSPSWDNKYIDHQLVQKVLTRLEGEEGEIENSIHELFKLCLIDASQITDFDSILEFNFFENSNVKFSLTAIKLKSMLYNLVELKKPMVSFWTS